MDQPGNAGDATMTLHQHEHERQGSVLTAIWHFVRHFVEMIIAMMLGMGIWRAILGVALAPTSLDDKIRDVPELYYGFMAIFMAIPMVLLMRFRRHSWERSWEMVGAMVAPTAVIILCWRFGLGDYLPFVSDSALGGSAHIAMLLGMLVLMLYRRKEYSHSGPHVAGVHALPQRP